MQAVLDSVSRFLDGAVVIVLLILVCELKRDVSEVKVMLERLSQSSEAGTTQPKGR